METRVHWRNALAGGLVLVVAQVVLACFVSEAPRPRGLCFNADGSKLAAVYRDHTVHVWNIEDGTNRQAFRPGYAPTVSLAFQADGTLVTALSNLDVMSWDPETGVRRRRWQWRINGSRARSFSQHGLHLASSSEALVVQDLDERVEARVICDTTVEEVALSADGHRLACACVPPAIHIWTLPEMSLLTLDAPKDPISSFAFDPAGCRLAVVSGMSVRVIDAEQGTPLWSTPETVRACAVAFRPDGKQIAVGREDGTITLHATQTGETTGRYPGNVQAIRALAYSADGSVLASVAEDDAVALWHEDEGDALRWLHRPLPRPYPLRFAPAYRGLAQWDAFLYADVVDRGYHGNAGPSDNRDTANFGFFPGHPLLGMAAQTVTGAGWLSVLLASQLAAWGFWTYLPAWLRTSGATRTVTALAVAAVFVHPGAFFLINGYSEALFLFAVLGFLFWQRGNTRAWGLTLVHGVIMTATRLVGLPLVAVPVCAALARRTEHKSRAVTAACSLGVLSSAGGLAYFVFSIERFGRWDAYFQAQRHGWGIVPDYFALLDWRIYFPTGLGEHPIGDLNRLSVPFTVLLFVLLLLREYAIYQGGDHEGWRGRLPLYLTAAIIFYISASAFYRLDMVGMSRYTFPVYVLLVLAAAEQARDWTFPVLWRHRLRLLILIVVGVAALAVQLQLIRRFTAGFWVA